MVEQIRFGAFVREITLRQRQVRYQDVIAHSDRLSAESGSRLRVRPLDAYRLMGPYVGIRFWGQFRTVVPLAIYLALFQLLILRQSIAGSWQITAGLVAVVVGLMLFMEGLKLGLMPFGERIGTVLPSRSSLPVVLIIVFLLGIGVTFAEPAIGALKTAGRIVRVDQAPYLFALLNDWSGALVLCVGAGVGLAAVLGTLRLINGWSLKPLIYLTLTPLAALTAYLAADPRLESVLGLAWDCGAVTTGPVTVPLVLALGIGMAAAAGKGRTSLSGFGIVTLASLFPILAVYLLALFVVWTVPIAEIQQLAARLPSAQDLAWYERPVVAELLSGARAIVPLVLFLFLVMRLVLREKLRNPLIIGYGILLCLLGMMLFNIGLSFGLARLGGQSGGLIPGAFTAIDAVQGSPLYVFGIGIAVTATFAWLLGFGATLAEPALNALGLTAENLSNGSFRKSTLMYAVSTGVGCGIAVGVLKIVFDLPVAWLVIPGYLIATLLTILSAEEFVNIAWDSAGVTTGPVTVPLVLAMGLGLGDAITAVEGFAILAMASIGPIITVLTTGLWVQWKTRRRHRREALDVEEAIAGESTP